MSNKGAPVQDKGETLSETMPARLLACLLGQPLPLDLGRSYRTHWGINSTISYLLSLRQPSFPQP